MELRDYQRISHYAEGVTEIYAIIWLNGQHYKDLRRFYSIEDEYVKLKFIASDFEKELKGKKMKKYP